MRLSRLPPLRWVSLIQSVESMTRTKKDDLAVLRNSCLMAFKLGHWVSPAFSFKLKRGLFLGLKQELYLCDSCVSRNLADCRFWKLSACLIPRFCSFGESWLTHSSCILSLSAGSPGWWVHRSASPSRFHESPSASSTPGTGVCLPGQITPASPASKLKIGGNERITRFLISAQGVPLILMDFSLFWLPLLYVHLHFVAAISRHRSKGLTWTV